MNSASRHHQLTVPAALLRTAGLKPGDVVPTRRTGSGRLELVRGNARAEPPSTADAVNYPPGYLEELRAGWA